MPKPPSAPEFSCADCPTKADCKAAFGRYWTDKSRGGVGCNTPFEPNVAEMARAMAKVERLKADAAKKVGEQIEFDF